MDTPPDKRTIYPWDEEGPLLSWYEGAYDAAFIALHPFLDVRPVAPFAKSLLEQVGCSDIPDDPYQALVSLWSLVRPGKVEDDHIYQLIKQYANPVSWETVREMAGFPNISAINHALLTDICALRSEFSDKAGAERLRYYCNSEAVFEPSEGAFQELMEAQIAELFIRAGIEEVETLDDWNLEAGPSRLPVTSLVSQNAWEHPMIPWRGSIYAPDHSMLVTVHLDSFFTLICGTSERLARVDVAGLFEGFWCSSTTSHHWWKAS